MGDLYVPVGIESIQTENFPDVALYLRSGTNFVLYKSHGRNFNSDDAVRLMENSVDFLYVSPSDLETITTHMEENAEKLMKDDSFDNRTKGKIMYQTSINFVGDIFENPEKVGDLNRSKKLIENLLLYLSADKEALSSLETVMSHNYFTFVHSLQVTALCILLHSEAYSVSHDELVDVGVGSLLHDFGKIFVAQEILNKPGRLTESEMMILKRHPMEGYDYLKEHTRLSDISLTIVRDHHERNNGNGYPRGLRGEMITRSAQASAVCDVYCTMTIDRTCRKALPPNISIHLMRQEMKGAFNERLLDALDAVVCMDNAFEMPV